MTSAILRYWQQQLSTSKYNNNKNNAKKGRIGEKKYQENCAHAALEMSTALRYSRFQNQNPNKVT